MKMVGLVSHSFGYGLMDAAAMVRLARRWRTVPEQHKCEVSAPHMGRLVNPPDASLGVLWTLSSEWNIFPRKGGFIESVESPESIKRDL